MNNFNQILMRAGFVKGLENTHVFTGVANKSFSGEIKKKNDIVKLNQMGNINIGSYVDGTSVTVQAVSDSALEIIADQDSYFAFSKDTAEIMDLKSSWFAEAGRKAGYAMNDTIDAAMAGLYAQAGIVRNTNASPVDMTSLNVEDEFLGMAEQFANAGVPRSARKFAIIPPWVSTKLALAAIATKTDNTQVYTQGYIGTALGWDFIESPNVSKNSTAWDKTRIMCGVYNESYGYAGAVTILETQPVEDQIGKTLVKGRYVYGYKIVRPDMTGVLYADKTAES